MRAKQIEMLEYGNKNLLPIIPRDAGNAGHGAGRGGVLQPVGRYSHINV
jgi:hypothetical protein